MKLSRPHTKPHSSHTQQYSVDLNTMQFGLLPTRNSIAILSIWIVCSHNIEWVCCMMYVANQGIFYDFTNISLKYIKNTIYNTLEH